MNVGVIGGADGPTEIFVTSSVNWGAIIGLTAVIAGCIVAFLICRKNRQ